MHCQLSIALKDAEKEVAWVTEVIVHNLPHYINSYSYLEDHDCCYDFSPKALHLSAEVEIVVLIGKTQITL